MYSCSLSCLALELLFFLLSVTKFATAAAAKKKFKEPIWGLTEGDIPLCLMQRKLLHAQDESAEE